MGCPTQVEVVIFIGLPASGKSSFYRARFAATHALVSKDLMRNNRNRDRWQRQLIEAALGAGRPVVVDNTNATAEARAPLIELAREHGTPAVGYYFESRLDDCLARNGQRQDKARVPDVAIYSIAARLAPPAYAEGFARLFHVRLLPGGEFQVSPWQDVSL